MRERIKIKFTDMWQSFSPFGYVLSRYLEERFPVEYSNDPDYVFFSISGCEHLKYNCEKVFLTHEAAYPDFRWCDYAITFATDIASPRHLQLPNFAVTIGYRTLERLKTHHLDVTDGMLKSKTRFCAYLASNGKAKARESIVDELSKYKTVDSGGRHRNNIGRTLPPAENIDFLGSAKFVVSGENSIAPGYVTEKIAFALLSHSIPIYWGDDSVTQYFNPKRFINARDFDSLDSLRKHVEKIDNSDDLYMQILSEPCLAENKLHPSLRKETLFDFFDGVFSGRLSSGARPVLEDAEYGLKKGIHRRVMRTPMTAIEADAFKEARDDYFKRELLDTAYSEVLMDIMRNL